MNKKQFSDEEKNLFLKNYFEQQEDNEYNNMTLEQEKAVTRKLIIIESALIIGSLVLVTFDWNFSWIKNAQSWLTNILVPLIIYNFINSIWMLIERKIRKIQLWIRLLFFFSSIIITFVISASLSITFYDLHPIRIIVGCSMFLASIVLFVFNYLQNRKDYENKLKIQTAIKKETQDDIEESRRKTKKTK